MATYNGWTNYETWNVNLWMMNDESAYRHLQSAVPVSASLARRVTEERYPDGTPDMDGPEDYGRVDWREIRDAWNEKWQAD